MYTQEDDYETSSRFRRHRLIKVEGDKTMGEQPAPSTEEAGREQIAAIPTQPGLMEASLASAPSVENESSAQEPPQRAQRPTKLLDPTSPSLSGSARVAGSAHHPGEAFGALTVACIAVFITALDQTVVVTALPQMIGDLQLSITQLDHAAWIISAYLLGFVVVMPLMGRVSDLYGRRRIFLLCLLIFGVSSVFCGLAPELGSAFNPGFLGLLGIDTSSPGLIWLVAARLVQAVGGGALVPLAIAIASDYFQYPQQIRTKGAEKAPDDVQAKPALSLGLALGIIGAVTEAGGAVGPLYGALIVDHLGWRYIFYLNVPLVIGLLIASWYFIPRGKRLRGRIDWLAAILLAAALTCFSLGLAQQGTALSPNVANVAVPQNNPIALLLALLFLALFVLVERKIRWPLIDLKLFRRLAFSASGWTSLLVGAALIIAMTDIPIYVDTVLRGSALDSGLALLRLTVMIPIGAVLGGWLCNRLTCRVVGLLGLLFTATGFYLMSRWPVIVDGWQMAPGTMTAGFGFGLVIAPISTTALNAVRPSQAGMSSAIVTALRMVGMMLGLALLTSWALSYFKQLAATYPSLPVHATTEQFSAWSKGYAAHLMLAEHTVYTNVFFISMCICLVALIPAFFLWGKALSVVDEPEAHDAPTVLIEEEEVLAAVRATETRPVPGGRLSRRRRILLAGSVALVVLISGGALAPWLFGDEIEYYDEVDLTRIENINTTPSANTPVAGPRRIQLVLDKGALTSLFAAQLQMQDDTISDLSVEPQSNDGLHLSLKLHIAIDSVQRVMPIDVSSKISLDEQQNFHLAVQELKRDDQAADVNTTAEMESALNKMLSDAVMPALHTQLKDVKLLSVHTSSTMACAQGMETLVLQIEAPAMAGVAAQPTPVPFCFSGDVDIKKLLPG
jgi:MFS family permease